MNNIIKIPIVFGKCGICGTETRLMAQCKSTLIKVGNCCVRELMIADKTLSAVPGICHPKP